MPIAEPAIDAPDEDWSVFADALQQAGDPRGELIALADNAEARDAHVAKHAAVLLGPAAEYASAYKMTWRRCYLDDVEVAIADAERGPALIGALFDSPAAKHLRGLSIAGSPASGNRIDLSTTIALVRDRLPASCRSLSLVDARARDVTFMVSRDYDPAEDLVTWGSLETLWPALAAIEHLHLCVADTAQLDFGGEKIDLPALKSFVLHDLRWSEGVADTLAGIHWPKLESFEIRLCENFTVNRPDDDSAYRKAYSSESDEIDDAYDGETYDPTDWHAELEPLRATWKDLPLRRLALTSFDNGASIAELFEDTEFPPTLVEVDLSDAAFSKDHVARLVKADVFGQLKKIVVENTSASAADAEKLGKGGATVVHSNSGSAPTYRFVTGME
jgi:hypothetical protein